MISGSAAHRLKMPTFGSGATPRRQSISGPNWRRHVLQTSSRATPPEQDRTSAPWRVPLNRATPLRRCARSSRCQSQRSSLVTDATALNSLPGMPAVARNRSRRFCPVRSAAQMGPGIVKPEAIASSRSRAALVGSEDRKPPINRRETVAGDTSDRVHVVEQRLGLLVLAARLPGACSSARRIRTRPTGGPIHDN